MKKITNLFVRFIVITLVATLLFSIVSCSLPDASELHNQEQANQADTTDGTSTADESDVGASSGIHDPDYIDQIVNPDRSLFYGETITIATWIPHMINHFAITYMHENPGVTIRVINYESTLSQNNQDIRHPRDWSFDTVQLEIATQLMAGSAPTLICGFLADPYDPRQSIYFFDWYQLMDADPNFNEEDWFINAFHAFSISNRLFHFPLSFRYEPVVTNSTIPGLVDAMTAYSDGVSISELIELHRHFAINHPGFYLEEYFTTRMLMQYAMGQFVDVEAGWVDFGYDFIDLITYVKSITCPDFDFRWKNSPETGVRELQKSERYLFHLDYNQNYLYFLDFYGERLFVNITPLVNDNGELLIESEQSFLLNTNATPIEKAIAWDFLMYVMDAENHSNFTMSFFFFQATNRNVLYHHVLRTLPEVARMRHGWFTGTEDEAIDIVLARKTAFGDMPMQNMRMLPSSIINIIDEAMGQFHDGLLSAEQTAELLQNQITLVLMEMER